MDAQKLKVKRADRRRHRVRKAIYGTPQKPRLSVSRSNLHISAQLIDDLNGITLAAATSAGKSSGLKHGANVTAATEVGKKLAEAAKAKGITVAAFDRGAFRFHGRIAALAVAATEGRVALHRSGIDEEPVEAQRSRRTCREGERAKASRRAMANQRARRATSP